MGVKPVKEARVKPNTLSVKAMAFTSWSSAMTNNDSLDNLMAVYQNVTIYLKQLFTVCRGKVSHDTEMHSIKVTTSCFPFPVPYISYASWICFIIA